MASFAAAGAQYSITGKGSASRALDALLGTTLGIHRGPNITPGGAMFVEGLFTFILVTVVLNVVGLSCHFSPPRPVADPLLGDHCGPGVQQLLRHGHRLLCHLGSDLCGLGKWIWHITVDTSDF